MVDHLPQLPDLAVARSDHGAPRSTPIRFTTTGGGPFIARRAEPVTFGVPLPRGACSDLSGLRVLDTSGSDIPLQITVLDRWADGSIRWALLDFQATVQTPSDEFSLVVGEAGTRAEPASPVLARHTEGAIEINTGRLVCRLERGGGDLVRAITIDGTPVIAPEQQGFSIEAREGRCTIAFDDVELEETGALRTVVHARGRAAAADGSTLVDLDARLHFFARSATVRVAVTLRNPRAATHPGGFWQLGDAGSVYLRDAAFSVKLIDDGSPCEAWWSEQAGGAAAPVSLPFEVYQESSGGAEWQHPNHRNREGVVPLRMRGYRMRSGEVDSTGGRATPVVGLRSRAAALALTLPLFWQNFPKAIEANSREVTLRLFPSQFGDLHELQGGEQKTHTFWLAFDQDAVTPLPLEWCRSALRPALPPEWYCATGVVPYLLSRSDDPERAYHALTDVALDASRGFVAKRELIDEYGWRDFGDLYADHEAAFQPDARIVSHYNNQYDAIAGFATSFMRTGDVRWWELADDLARHVADIDIYRTDADKAAYNHALFWHTYHYVDAGRSTHRSYPRAAGAHGGGPSNEHNYAAGLALHHFLTGDPISREAAIGLARWVVAMDDGRRTVFRWLARTPTGLASQTHSADYHGPGRGAGHSVRALLDGHRLTGDAALLNKAEELIRRVIHPQDDLQARNLLDAERRWSYTAFLQALGFYLDYKAERGEIDRMYAYAQASLIHYAQWMTEHEYPYLDKPEILEYPTETWAAQDIRKSDVFYFAARHARGAERDAFVERAQFFFHHSVSSLGRMETRALARPIVLLLSNGLLHGALARSGVIDAPRAAREADFGAARSFIPQKAIAMRRALALAALGGTLLLFGMAFVLMRF